MSVSELDRLSGAHYVALTSYDADGMPVRSPVWVAREADHLYMITQANSEEVTRIKNNPHVDLSPCDAHGNPQGGASPGVASLVTDPRRISRAKKLLKSKYHALYFISRSLVALRRRTQDTIIIRLDQRPNSFPGD